MTVAVESSGTQAATISTEHSLAAPTSAKTRQLVVDLTNLASDDVVILRVKRKGLTGGTIRTYFEATYYGPQESPIVTSVPIAGPFGATFTLEQSAGTGRNFDWSVETLD